MENTPSFCPQTFTQESGPCPAMWEELQMDRPCQAECRGLRA